MLAQVCGKDADGGNHQNGCGKAYGWSSVPKMDVGDLDQPTADVEVNTTDLHFDVRALQSDHRQTPLTCKQCSKDIYGARFECMSCVVEKGKPRDSLCLTCVLVVIKHNHVTSSDSLPFTHPGCAAVRITAGSLGRTLHICKACGGKYAACHGSYGYRDRNGTWSSGECRADGHVPESPNDQWCSQRCEDKGETLVPSAHQHHAFDIIDPPSTESAVSLLLAEISSEGEVALFSSSSDQSLGKAGTETLKKVSVILVSSFAFLIFVCAHSCSTIFIC